MTERERLLGAAGAGLLVGVLAALSLRQPEQVRVVETHETVRTATKYSESVKIVTRFIGGPGTKTTVYPDGHYVIEGAVTFDQTLSKTSTGEALTDRKLDTKETTAPAVGWRSMLVATGSAPLAWPPVPALEASYGHRAGQVWGFDLGWVAGASWGLAGPIPTALRAGVVVTWR